MRIYRLSASQEVYCKCGERAGLAVQHPGSPVLHFTCSGCRPSNIVKFPTKEE